VSVVEFAISVFKVEKSLTSFSPFDSISSVFISLSCAIISSALILLSCFIISAVALLSAALMQDKVSKANKIIVANMTLCLIKISSYKFKNYFLYYIFV